MGIGVRHAGACAAVAFLIVHFRVKIINLPLLHGKPVGVGLCFDGEQAVIGGLKGKMVSPCTPVCYIFDRLRATERVCGARIHSAADGCFCLAAHSELIGLKHQAGKVFSRVKVQDIVFANS